MIYIIGAGPVGCYAGYLLAKSGQKVIIFEEHKSIGTPVQCTGLLTNSINKIIKLEKGIIVNRIKKARTHYNGTSFETGMSDIVVDRQKFDQFLANKALKAGCKLFLNHKFIGINNHKIIIKNLKNKKTKLTPLDKTDCLIGADGPGSIVRNYVDKKNKISHWVGIQAIAKLKTSGDTFEVYLDKAPGFFGWGVAENKNIVRIGLAAKKPGYYFKSFLQIKKIKKKDVIELQGGLIPRYNPQLKVQRNNIYLVGDAAAHVKATTGGGIVPGLIAAECLAESILQDKDYQKLLSKRVNTQLRVHLKVRKILDKFSKGDLSYLIKLCNQRKIKNILKKVSRDSPVKLLLLLAIREPRFLLFLKYLLKV